MNLIDPKLFTEVAAELNTYAHSTKTEIFNDCLNERLAAQLRAYNEEIDATSAYLLKQSSVRVLKALMKMHKVDDKEIISQYLED